MKKWVLLISWQFAAWGQLTAQKFEPERPAEATDVKQATAAKLTSTLAIPVDISLVDIEKQINAAVGPDIYVDDSFTNNNQDDLKMRVTKTRPIAFTQAIGDRFDFSVPIKVWVQKGYGAFGYKQYQETTFEMIMKFSTRFGLAEDWSVTTYTNAQGYTWITKPVLKFGSVEIPIGPVVGKVIELNLQSIARTIDNSVSKDINLSPYVLDAWNKSLEPVLLQEEYQVWLRVIPVQVYCTPIVASNRRIKMTLGLKAYTETFTGKKPAASARLAKAPAFTYVQTIPDQFQIGLVNTIDYDVASALAQKQLGGSTYAFKKKEIKFEQIKLYGSADRLVFEILTSGAIKGTLFIKSMPIYNPAEQRIELSATEFDIKTRNVLVKAAAWIFDGTLERKITENFQIPLKEDLASAQKEIQTALNQTLSPGVQMSGQLTHLVPSKIVIAQEGLAAIVQATGKMQLKVEGL